jgi:hypothetical protein
MGFASCVDKIEKLRTEYFGLMLEAYEAKFAMPAAPVVHQISPSPAVQTAAEVERIKEERARKLREVAILGLMELRPSPARRRAA